MEYYMTTISSNDIIKLNKIKKELVTIAGYLKVDVEKFELQPVNTQIDSEIFEKFQKKCKERNLQMCTVIETFVRQYLNGRYKLKEEDILKWKDNNSKTSTLNTPINKIVYYRFKDKIKADGYYIRHILSAFIEDYVDNNLVMEFVETNEE